MRHFNTLHQERNVCTKIVYKCILTEFISTTVKDLYSFAFGRKSTKIYECLFKREQSNSRYTPSIPDSEMCWYFQTIKFQIILKGRFPDTLSVENNDCQLHLNIYHNLYLLKIYLEDINLILAELSHSTVNKITVRYFYRVFANQKKVAHYGC